MAGEGGGVKRERIRAMQFSEEMTIHSLSELSLNNLTLKVNSRQISYKTVCVKRHGRRWTKG